MPEIKNELAVADGQPEIKKPPEAQLQQGPTHHPQALQLTAGLTRLKAYIASHKEGDGGVLRDGQVPVMEAIAEFLEDEEGKKRGFAVLPTGYGKTVLFIELLELLGLKGLVVVPRTELLYQTEQRSAQFAPGMEIGKVFEKEKTYGKQTTIITYQSLGPQIEAGNLDPKEYDIVILDEAHNALSEAKKELVTTKFRDDAIVIGVTATDKYSEEKQLGNILPKLICRVELRDAIGDAALCALKCIVVKTNVVDLSQVKVTDGDYAAGELEKAINKKVLNAKAVELYLKAFQGKKAVIFCGGIAHADAAAKEFNDAGVPAAAIHSGMSDYAQREAYGKYKTGEIKVLTGDKKFIEGFDDVEVCVAMNLKPTLSLVEAAQRGGRPLRVNENDPYKFATVVDFLYPDDRNRPQILFADIAGENPVLPAGKTLREREFRDRIEGNIGVQDDLLRSLNIDRLDIVTDAETVLKLSASGQMAEAPEGWVSESELSACTNLNKRVVMSVFYERGFGEEDRKRFLLRRGEKARETYYSPRAVAAIVHKNELASYGVEFAPDSSWKTIAEIAETASSFGHLFDTDTIASAASVAVKRGIGVMTLYRVKGGFSMRKYCSSELVLHLLEQFAPEAAHPQASAEEWIDSAALCEELKIHPLTLERIQGSEITGSKFLTADRKSVRIHFTLTDAEKIRVAAVALVPPKGWNNMDEMYELLHLGSVIGLIDAAGEKLGSQELHKRQCLNKYTGIGYREIIPYFSPAVFDEAKKIFDARKVPETGKFYSRDRLHASLRFCPHKFVYEVIDHLAKKIERGDLDMPGPGEYLVPDAAGQYALATRYPESFAEEVLRFAQEKLRRPNENWKSFGELAQELGLYPMDFSHLLGKVKKGLETPEVRLSSYILVGDEERVVMKFLTARDELELHYSPVVCDEIRRLHKITIPSSQVSSFPAASKPLAQTAQALTKARHIEIEIAGEFAAPDRLFAIKESCDDDYPDLFECRLEIIAKEDPRYALLAAAAQPNFKEVFVKNHDKKEGSPYYIVSRDALLTYRTK